MVIAAGSPSGIAPTANATAATRYYDGLTLKQIWCEYRLISHYQLRPDHIFNEYYKVNNFTLDELKNEQLDVHEQKKDRSNS